MGKPDMDIAGRTAARQERMENPRMSRLGTISIGQKVRWCLTCHKPIPVDDIPKGSDRCPQCGGDLQRESPGKLNYFRFRGFPPDIAKLIEAKLDKKPIRVPFTWPAHPAQFVIIGRECYQGSHLHCHNHWTFNFHTNQWENPGRAERRIGRGMRRESIVCNPQTCPYVIGNDQIKPGQCGEVVIAYVWLYDFPGLELVRFKSGGINSINAFQDAVRKLLSLQAGNWRALKLELRIRAKATKYPDPKTGEFRQTDIYEVYVHFPEAVGALLEKQAAGTLEPGDIYIELPGTDKRRMLPPPPEQGTYDDLVDGPRAESRTEPLPEPKAIDVGDVRGRTEPLPVQADDTVKPETLERLKSLMLKIGGDENGAKGILKQLRRIFAVEKGQRIDTVPEDKALQMIKNLEARLANDVSAAMEEDDYTVEDVPL